MHKIQFPKDFLQRGTVPVYRCERAWKEDGKGFMATDLLTVGSREIPREFTPVEKDCYYPVVIVIGHYHHYKEDIALFVEMGFKVYHMSISRVRIFPNGDDEVSNPTGLVFYHRIFQEYKKYDIESLVTISHHDASLALALKQDGWLSRKTIPAFVAHCKTIFREYRDEMKCWIIFNEIDMTTNYFGGIYTGGILSNGTRYLGIARASKESLSTGEMVKHFTTLHHQLIASALATQTGRNVNPNFQIGSMVTGDAHYPYSYSPVNVIEARQSMNHLWYCGDAMVHGGYFCANRHYLKGKGVDIEAFGITEEDKYILKKGTIDFLAFSYYTSGCHAVDKYHEATAGNFSLGVTNPYLKKSDWGQVFDPQELRQMLNELYGRYHIPVFIVKNGLDVIDGVSKDGKIHDSCRIRYLNGHVSAIWDALEDDVDLLGYT